MNRIVRAIWRWFRPSKGHWVRVPPASLTSGTAGSANTVSTVFYQYVVERPRYEWRPNR